MTKATFTFVPAYDNPDVDTTYTCIEDEHINIQVYAPGVEDPTYIVNQLVISSTLHWEQVESFETLTEAVAKVNELLAQQANDLEDE